MLEKQPQGMGQETQFMDEPTHPPQFKVPIKDQLGILEGGIAHFEARLDPVRDHSMKVEWYKDGKLVEASSRISTIFASRNRDTSPPPLDKLNVALIIKPVNQNDAGTYTCVACNTCGRDYSSAKLTTLPNVAFQNNSRSSIQQMEVGKGSGIDQGSQQGSSGGLPSSEEWFQNRMQHQQNHATYSEVAGRTFQTDHSGASPYKPPFPPKGGGGTESPGLYPRLNQDELDGDRFTKGGRGYSRFEGHPHQSNGHYHGERRLV